MSILTTIREAARAITAPALSREPEQVSLNISWLIFLAGAIGVAREFPIFVVLPIVSLGAGAFSLLTTRAPVGGWLVPVRNAVTSSAVIATAMIATAPGENKMKMSAAVPEKLGAALQTACWTPNQEVKLVFDNKVYKIKAHDVGNRRESMTVGQVGMPPPLSPVAFLVTKTEKVWRRSVRIAVSFVTKPRRPDRPYGVGKNCTPLDELTIAE